MRLLLKKLSRATSYYLILSKYWRTKQSGVTTANRHKMRAVLGHTGLDCSNIV